VIFVFVVITVGLASRKPDENRIKEQYTVLLFEKKYEQAYSLLSDRMKDEVGTLEKFKEKNTAVDESYRAYGIKEELVKDSVKVQGNIVTFRTKSVMRNLLSTTRILEGRVYMTVVGGKIDFIQVLGAPETIEETESSSV